jgi:hypothetical protein
MIVFFSQDIDILEYLSKFIRIFFTFTTIQLVIILKANKYIVLLHNFLNFQLYCGGSVVHVELLLLDGEVASLSPACGDSVKPGSGCSFARTRHLKVRITGLSNMTLKTNVSCRSRGLFSRASTRDCSRALGSKRQCSLQFRSERMRTFALLNRPQVWHVKAQQV